MPLWGNNQTGGGMLIKNHKTKLYCPDSDIKDWMDALQTNFWIDEQDVWNVDCHVCGGEHNLGDMLDE